MIKHQTSPNPSARHAADVATIATREAVAAGMDPVDARNVWANVYAAVMRGER